MKKLILLLFLSCIFENSFALIAPELIRTDADVESYFEDSILVLDKIEGIYHKYVFFHNDYSGATAEYADPEYDFAIIKTGATTYSQWMLKEEKWNTQYSFKRKFKKGEVYSCVMPGEVSDIISIDGKLYFEETAGRFGTYRHYNVYIYPTEDMIVEAQQKARETHTKPTTWSGSAFALNKRFVATNFHCVDGASVIRVKGIGGDFVKSYSANVVASDKINDLAIIEIIDSIFEGFKDVPYNIKRTQSEVGETVWTLGYPMLAILGDEIKFTNGVISSRSGFQGDVSAYQISVPIQPGNSGGPLFDNNGNIVGITSSGVNRELGIENVNYAVKSTYLINLIESILDCSIIPSKTVKISNVVSDNVKLVRPYVLMIVCSSE